MCSAISGPWRMRGPAQKFNALKQQGLGNPDIWLESSQR